MNAQKKLDILLKLGQLISTEKDLNIIIDVLADVSRDVSEADRCSIYIYDKDKQSLWTKVAHKMDRTIRLSLGEGIAGEVALKQKIEIISNVYQDDRFNKRIDKESGYKTEQMLVVPIVSKRDDTLGVIQVLNKKDGLFNKNDVDAIVLIANYASAIIENIFLYIEQEKRIKEEIEKNKEKDRIIFEQTKVSAMTDMISAIAHNWRQPLNAVSLILSDLKEGYDAEDLSKEYFEESVNKVYILLTKMSKTIDDFRLFFRNSKQKEYFKLDTAIKDIILLLESQYEESGIKIIFNAKVEDYEFLGYQKEFKRIIFNLLKNSKDAFCGNIKNIDKHIIQIDLKKSNDGFNIILTDNAGGVQDELIDRIFEPYFTTKEQGQGIGMGLYNCKMVVENQLQGEIYASNFKSGLRVVIKI
jgi:C4-dicarboxylate-specific signal transduction histidine kinase